MANPTCWELVAATRNEKLAAGQHVLLSGPKGTGKTTLAERSAAPGQPIYSTTCWEDMSYPDVFGFMVPDGTGSARHFDSVGALAWRNNGLLILNELNEAGTGALMALYSLLDGIGTARTTLLSGETIRPNMSGAPYAFRCFATMNVGPEALPEPLADRFAHRIVVDFPSDAAFDSLGVHADWLPGFGRAIYRDSQNGCASFRELLHFGIAIGAGIEEKPAAFLVWGIKAVDVLTTMAVYRSRDKARIGSA